MPFTIKPGRHVKITFVDTGVGMDKDTQQRVFYPFLPPNRGRDAKVYVLRQPMELLKATEGVSMWRVKRVRELPLPFIFQHRRSNTLRKLNKKM